MHRAFEPPNNFHATTKRTPPQSSTPGTLPKIPTQSSSHFLHWAPARRSLREAKSNPLTSSNNNNNNNNTVLSSTKMADAGPSTLRTPLSVASPGQRTPLHPTCDNISTFTTPTNSQQLHLYNSPHLSHFSHTYRIRPQEKLPRPLLTFPMFVLHDIQVLPAGSCAMSGQSNEFVWSRLLSGLVFVFPESV